MKNTILAMLWLILTSLSLQAQTGNPTRDSYQKALETIKESFTAMGGAENLDKINNISFRLEGQIHARNQSFRSTGDFDRFPVETKAVFDLEKERLHWEQKNSLPGGLFFANRLLVSRREAGFNLNLERLNYTALPANPPVYGLAVRLFPIYFLDKLLESRANLRYLGETRVAGKTFRLVGVVWNNQVFTLYFDAVTKLLWKQETLAFDASVGDDLFEFLTTDYKTFEGVLLPTKYEQRRTGKTVRVSEYKDYRFNQKLEDNEFKLPNDFKLFQTPTFAVKKIAEQVFLAEGLVGGAYRVLFVELADGVLVVDAPGSSAVSSGLIRQIKEAIPNKPIKYLVLTHFHDDHTGGLRPYVAEGAKIVTTAKNRTFFEAMIRAEYTIAPDDLWVKPPKPDFLFVENEQKFGNAQPVIVRNINSVHAEDMYLVYLPKEKIVFQSDLYNWPDKAVTDSTVDMTEKIEKYGWTVETVIGSHSGAVSFKQILDEVRELKSNKR